MIHFERFTLTNGLTVIIHANNATPLAAVNMLYRTGAKHDPGHRAGMAHLVEHLMCYGSRHIQNYDHVLQRAGGSFNAETSHDWTQYFIQLPAANIETALWIESDRMGFPDITTDKLMAQQRVVCEEFAQVFLSDPYHEWMPAILSMAYKTHPYKTMVIGKHVDEINSIRLQEVQDFVRAGYQPGNAILTIAGGIDTAVTLALVQKWFGDIPGSRPGLPALGPEPRQSEGRFDAINRDVPSNMLVKAFQMDHLGSDGYRRQAIIADILGGGLSSRLVEELVKRKQVFAGLSCDTTDALDGGLLIITGMLPDGILLSHADQSLQATLDPLMSELITPRELAKIKNGLYMNLAQGRLSSLAIAQQLAMAEMLGDAALVNTDITYYESITPEGILCEAASFLSPARQNTLYYAKTPVMAEEDTN